MDEGLRRAWREAVAAGRSYRDGEDPEPVLAALGLALVLSATGAKARAEEGRALRSAGARALLGGDGASSELDEDLGWARAVARAGLDVLAGRRPLLDAVADPVHPPAGRLVDMLAGRPDGLSAGACAAHVLGCPRCAAALRVSSRDDSRRLRVAASGEVPMRPPSEGRVLARLEAPAVEVVLFDAPPPRSLAIYAADPVPVRLEAAGVATEQMLGGYWLGRVAEEATGVEGILHVGDISVALTLEL